MANPWLSVEEIAEHLGVGPDTVYRWIKRNNMPAHRVGRFWKFDQGEVDEWVRAGKAADSNVRRKSGIPRRTDE